MLISCIVLSWTSVLMANHTMEFDDFEEPPPPPSPFGGWIPHSTSPNPFAPGNYLGPFGNETVTKFSAELFPLLEVRPFEITVEFDLLIQDAWVGNAIEPSLFVLKDQLGSNLLRTSFSNFPDRTQSFPSPYPGASFPGQTSAIATVSAPEVASLYHIELRHILTSNTWSPLLLNHGYALNFSAEGLSQGASWGLDNVRVSYQVIPESSSLRLVLVASIVVAFRTIARPKYLRGGRRSQNRT
jgi:hypothetical protein